MTSGFVTIDLVKSLVSKDAGSEVTWAAANGLYLKSAIFVERCSGGYGFHGKIN